MNLIKFNADCREKKLCIESLVFLIHPSFGFDLIEISDRLLESKELKMY